MVTCAKVSRIYLIVFNVILLLVGVGLLVFGFLLALKMDVLYSFWQKFEESFGISAGFMHADLETSNLKLNEITPPLGYACMALGLVISLVAVMGSISALYGLPHLLLLYALLNLAVIVGVTLVYLYLDKSIIDQHIKPPLKTSLSKFTSFEGNDLVSRRWNAVMSWMECCGIDGAEDFDHWVYNPPVDFDMVPRDLPLMCCRVREFNTSCPLDQILPACYDKLYQAVFRHPALIAGFIALLVVETTLVMAAVVSAMTQ